MQWKSYLLLHRVRTPLKYSQSVYTTIFSLSTPPLLPPPPSSPPLLLSFSSGPHCVAVYEFKAGGPDELSMAVGDTVELLARVGAEWLKGRLGQQEGIFPRDFVEIRQDLPEEKPPDKTILSTTLYDFDGQEGELSFKVCIIKKKS